jgi:hypothetical protein
MYRIVETDSGLQLYFGRNMLTSTANVNDVAAANLRRFAETHAGHELDWKGGTVRWLEPFRNLPCIWQAPTPHLGLAA